MDVVVSKRIYAFADFLLDAERRLLLRGGEIVNLHPKAFDLLLALIENRDRVLSKNKLLDSVWEGQFVEENNLAVQISTLRKIFGEKKEEHRFIVTVPGKGYRFIAEVREINEPPENAVEKEIADSDADKSFSNSLKIKTESKKPAAGYFLPLGIGVILIAVIAFAYLFIKPKPEFKQVKLSKLTTSGKITDAALTNDGKFAVLAQREGEGESLRLKQIETGTQTRLTAPQSGEYIGLSVSPDDKYIYFSVFQDNKSDSLLKQIPLLGGAVREIAGIESGVAITFAPDGKRFAFTKSNSAIKETRLVVADSDGSNAKVLLRAQDETRKFPTYKANPAAWSPGGDEIACSVIEKNSEGVKAGILAVDAETGKERYLLSPRFAWIDDLVWTDKDNLAFIAGETDEWSSQIWTVSKTTGETKKLTNDLNRYFRLSSADNSLLTIQETSVSNLQVADFDENLKEFQPPREILNETGIDYPVFGADNSIYYISQSGGKREIWRIETDGSNPAQLTTDACVSYGFAVSPIDNSIFFSSAREGRHSLWKADSNGSNFRRLTDGDDIAPKISFDGKQIIFQRGLYDVPSVWKMSVSDFKPIQLTNNYSIKPAISPDASKAAYYFMDDADESLWQIGLVTTETGRFLGKLSFPTTVNERRMVWHPSGKFLTQIVNSGNTANLLLLPADGSKPRIITGLGKGNINSFDWSRDGKKIVFSQITATQDAVLLTQF